MVVSEVTNFSSNDIESWLKEQTSSILTPVQEQAQKLRNDMHDAIQNFADVGKMLVDTSSKEIEKRNMRTYNRARAMNKLARLFTDRIKKVTVPAQVSYDEICSAAFDGLIEAVEAYDPSRLAKFETFCQQRISGAVMDWLRSLDPQSRTVRTFEKRRLAVKEALEPL